MAGIDETRAEASAEAAASGLVEGIAERIGASTSAAAVFGEPVERDGITVIPVARASWGFGGGSGGEPPNEGAGGGGGSHVAPLGYIEVHGDRAEFKRLRDPRLTGAAVAVGAGVLGFALARLGRRR